MGLVLLIGGAGLWRMFRKSPWGPFLIALSVASGWIALASFPLTFSKWPLLLLYPPLLILMGLPLLFRPVPDVFRLACGLMAAAVLLTPPGRRFSGGGNHPHIQALADTADGPRGAVSLVHQLVERRPGPPTDTAVDTLHRRHGHCGGINNVLHKVLLAQGVDCHIIHVERMDGADAHTLVEVKVNGTNYLADAQEDVFLPAKAEDLLQSVAREDFPPAWQNYDFLYRYSPRRGYVRQK